MPHVFIYPANDTQNDFIIALTEHWTQQGYTVSKSLKEFRHIDWFVLNWYENIYTRPWFTYIKKCLFLYALWLCGKKIEVYVHNLHPHRKYTATPHYALSQRLLRLLIRRATRVVTLTTTTCHYFDAEIRNALAQAKSKTIHRPHPHFDALYNVTSQLPHDGTLRLLHFGQIEQYKGVEIAIEAMNRLQDKNIELHIVGSCSPERQITLRQLAHNPRIHFRFEFVPNEDLAALFAPFDYTLFPLDTTSCLNSSSVILSHSLHTPVICPHISTLDDLPAEAAISYTYTSTNEHINILTQILSDQTISQP